MKNIKGTDEAWDSGQLGQDPKHAKRSPIDNGALDEAVGLKSISVRMPNSLIDDLKAIAEINGLGYQPLMKQVLTRFVESEKKKALREKASEARRRAAEEYKDREEPQAAVCG
ncbi:hypothetical protein [Marinobacterium lutimaris]|uniref:Uncharacterized protein n=1 Tax=Marinobacterium lutimaris TaxID=568106 RepID=A0A1H5XLQ3_9GAMM|nr:hypothetical protein [Marinobacterium lutimaris]SEG12668.1 hypothetical protein SAMN05444390_1011430 [Marinobacterium lutimaris]